MIVVGMELLEFLLAVQRNVRGVEVEHQFSRLLVVAGDDLRGQDLVQLSLIHI